MRLEAKRTAGRRAPVTLIHTGLRLTAILLCGIAVGFLLLTLAYAVPFDAMRGNLERSLSVFDGSEGTAEDVNETLVRTYPSTWLDNATDQRFLLHAAYTSDEPLTRQALLAPWYSAGDGEPFLTSLQARVLDNDPQSMITFSYARYWHGYLIILKPLLTLFSYQDIRMTNLMVQGALLMALFLMMVKRGLARYLPALGCALLCLTPFVLPLCMQYAVVYTLTLTAMLVLLTLPRVTGEGKLVIFLLTGMATSYFDLLTYPLLTFGLPFALALLLEERSGQRLLPAALGLSAAWLFGYIGLWAGKWLLLALAGETDSLRLVWDTISTRVSAEEVTRLSAILRNVAVLWRKPFKLAGLAVLAAGAVCWFRGRSRHKPVPPALALTLTALAALPFLWYALTANHSHIHYFYTHRILAVTVFALLCLLTRLCERRPLAEGAGGEIAE